MYNKKYLESILLVFFSVALVISPISLQAFQNQNRDNIDKISSVSINPKSYLLSETEDTFYKVNIDKKIALNLKNASMAEALKEVAAKTGLRLTYRGIFTDEKEITIKNKSISVGKALSVILDGTGFDYKVSQAGYLLVHKIVDNGTKVLLQTVSGTVTDANSGETMPGVNVVVKGTTIGTSTDSEGVYELEVPSLQDTLIFSFIGYQTRTIPINGRTQIDVSLQTQAVTGEDVVVVGYGTQRKTEVVGSVSQVSPDQILDKPSPNVLKSLRGKVAGVNVYTNSGSPTGTNRIIIRGMGSINSDTDPLWVVDGVAMNSGIEFLNPNDIKSIEVLKDASATAIYGARGANGVILVTTKRGGAPGQEEVDVSVNSRVSIGVRRGKMNAMNSEQFMEVQRRGFQNAPLFEDFPPGQEPVLDLSPDIGGPRALFDENGDPIYNTDWQELVSRQAFSTDHQIGIEGGNPNSSYGAYMNYNRTEGVLLSSYLKRASIKLVFDSSPMEWLRIGSNMMINRTWSNELNETSGGFTIRRDMVEFAPILPPKWPNGEFTQHADIQSIQLEGQGNPLQIAREHKNLRDRMQIFGNTYLEFDLLPNLEFRTQFGIDNVDTELREFAGRNLRSFGGFPDGEATIFEEEETFWQVENFLTYENEIGRHRINSVGGATWQQNDFRNSTINVEGFTSDFSGFNNVDAASIVNPPTSDTGKWTINSYFLRSVYTFDDRYSVNFTGRVDGSSRFGENQQYGFFPSVGAGWTITNEPFMDNKLEFIDHLKLRGSWGKTGNTEIGLFNSLATIGSSTGLVGGQRVNTAFATRLPNPDLKWEVTRQWDIGIELDAFNQRIQVEADYYNKRTNDLIIDRPIPASTGFAFVTDNVGSVLNQGADVKITTDNIRRSNFQWRSTLNFNYNFNKIKDLGVVNEIFPGPFWVSGSQTILRVGQSIGNFFGFERLGTWNTDEAAEAAEVGAIPGEAKRSETRKIIGNGLPNWTGSFIHNFNYKNWDLTLDFEFAAGVDIVQQFLHSSEDRTGLTNGLATQLTKAWTPENQDTPIQRIRNFTLSGQNTQLDSHWVVSGAYLRGNQFTLGYTFDSNFLTKYGMESVRLNASVDNAFVLTADDFKGFDPVGTSWLGTGNGGQFAQNIFFYQFPKPRTVSFEVNIRF